MIDGEGLVFKEQEHKNGKDSQRKEFLNHFELPKIERPSVIKETYSVRGYHETVLYQSYSPTK